MIEFLQGYNLDIEILDVLDIGIVAFVIYKILGFISESRAEQLIKGVLILVVLTVLTDVLQLHTFHWILKEGMAVGILALVIVFQPELRRALEYMGRSKILNNKITHMSDEAGRKIVRELVSAVISGSKIKQGMLIIIERETSLTDICETGTRIDATITAELIENIFYEKAPLHDGAIIIRGDRIHSAGCVLPLTQNTNLSKEFGTRHRASLGISEHSDCISIVVSEETGLISICEDGVLERFKDAVKLKNKLSAVYNNQENKIFKGFKNAVSSSKKEDKNV